MRENRSNIFFFVRPCPEQEAEDMRAALAHEPMRRIFRRLLASSNVMGPSFAADDKSAAFNEGLRAVGLWLAARIERAAPGRVAALMRESGEELAAYTLSQRER